MKNKNNHKNDNNNTATVVTFLTREQLDYLDKLGKDCFFKFGHKISRAKILSELVNLLMRFKLKFEDLDLENESLCEAIERLLKNDAQNKP